MPAPTWNLADLFEAVVDLVGDREAVVTDHERVTYAGLDARANRLAHLLASLGVGPGDRVGVVLRNGSEHLEAVLASYKLRAIPFNVNYRYTENEMRYLLDDARPRVVLHGPELDPAVGPAVEQLTRAGERVTALVGRGPDHEARLGEHPPVRPPVAGRSGDDLYLLYTGGTTGMPKGVEWRHEDILFAALGAAGGVAVAHADAEPPSTPTELVERARRGGIRAVTASPFIHGTAQWVALGTLLAGGTVVTTRSSTFVAADLWDLVEAEAGTVVVIVGDAFGRPLADALTAEPDRWDLGSVVAVVSGGAVLSPAVRDELAAHLPWVAVVDGYGTSETGGQGNAVTWPGQPTTRAARFPLGGHTAVVDEDGTPLLGGIDTGRIGLIARRGHIPLGYRNDPEHTRATFPVIDGERWAVPGDVGRVEDDGTVTLLGRGASCINTGGEKVFPDEVEAVLKAHPDVFDAAVVGVPDDRWGERVAAVVAPRPGRTPSDADLDEHCRAHLAAYKVPRTVVTVAEVRRLPSGKADHAWLRATAAAPTPPRSDETTPRTPS